MSACTLHEEGICNGEQHGKSGMTYTEIVANIIVRDQQIKDINGSIEKLQDFQCADGTAIYYLEKARWTLSQERNELQKQLEAH